MMSIYCKLFGHSASNDTLKLYLNIFYYHCSSTDIIPIECGRCGKYVIMDLDKSRHNVVKIYEKKNKVTKAD